VTSPERASSLEAVSLVGDVALTNGEPQVHAHVVVARSDGSAYGGHLLEAHVWPTLEVVLVETPSAPATPARRRDRPAAHSPLTMRIEGYASIAKPVVGCRRRIER
jgi:predicted DNA-binding protein with PD1-like motif